MSGAGIQHGRDNQSNQIDTVKVSAKITNLPSLHFVISMLASRGKTAGKLTSDHVSTITSYHLTLIHSGLTLYGLNLSL